METSVVAAYVREGKTMTERHTWYNHLSRGGRACLLAAGIPVSALLRLELGQTASWQQNTCTQELAGWSTHNRNRARKIASYPGRPGYEAQWRSEGWAWLGTCPPKKLCLSCLCHTILCEACASASRCPANTNNLATPLMRLGTRFTWGIQ